MHREVGSDFNRGFADAIRNVLGSSSSAALKIKQQQQPSKPVSRQQQQPTLVSEKRVRARRESSSSNTRRRVRARQNHDGRPSRTHPKHGQMFDEVRIKTVPRFKESEYSGSEWRISAVMELLYKGKIVVSDSASTVDRAIERLAGTAQRYADDNPWRDTSQWRESKCDQEGCTADATTLYKLKKRFCDKGCGHELEQFWPSSRAYCTDHAVRGDQALEDADDNYELLDGVEIAPPRPEPVVVDDDSDDDDYDF